MFIWPVLEWCLTIFVAVLVITQMIIPALLDRPLFPLFRRSYKEKERLEEELRDLNVQKETKAVREEVVERRKEVQEKPRKRGKSK